MSIQILDIYASNRVDLAIEKATGTDGVLIKAGQGEWPEYLRRKSTRISECQALDLPWGVFWQMDARYSPEGHKAAIKEFHAAIGSFGAMGLWLACELPFYPMPDWMYWRLRYPGYKHIMSVWDSIYQTFGTAPGIYTSVSKWTLIFGRAPERITIQLATNSPLWVAQYKVTQPERIGKWGDRWTLWQYTENPDYSIAREDWWAEVLRRHNDIRSLQIPVAPDGGQPALPAGNLPRQQSTLPRKRSKHKADR